jgi:hypothetical protein
MDNSATVDRESQPGGTLEHDSDFGSWDHSTRLHRRCQPHPISFDVQLIHEAFLLDGRFALPHEDEYVDDPQHRQEPKEPSIIIEWW